MMSMMDTEARRIVLLGKTGTGKSSLANTIIGEKIFVENNSPNSGTAKCESKTRNIMGRDIQLVDTPGLFDTNPEDTNVSPEILKCIVECSPGPHAFLVVLKIEKYTVLEMAVVNMIVKYFSEEALKYTTVVFTRGDDLPEGMKVEEWVSLNQSLNELVQKCGGRCHVFDNKYWKNPGDEYRNNQYQISELLNTIEKTVADNEGKYYTNDLLKKTGEQIKQEMARLKATLSGDISDEILYKIAKENIFKILWTHMKGNPVGMVLGALLGVGVMVPLVVFALPCIVSGTVIGLASVAVGAVAGGGIQHAIKKKRKHRHTEQSPMEQESENEDVQEEQEEYEETDELTQKSFHWS
ncbi:hypothetical protein WMY93_022701 [Mugilogobius chulae]|uniref:AIG1-type G domain-containing protein n=1 Tax=Mugilogobius chulae TaxID=88201 RepID=A0AAW0NBW0_9GOBI